MNVVRRLVRDAPGEIPGLFCYHGSLKQVIGRLYKRHLPLEIFFQNNFKGEIFMSEQVLRGGNAMERSSHKDYCAGGDAGSSGRSFDEF